MTLDYVNTVNLIHYLSSSSILTEGDGIPLYCTVVLTKWMNPSQYHHWLMVGKTSLNLSIILFSHPSSPYPLTGTKSQPEPYYTYCFFGGRKYIITGEVKFSISICVCSLTRCLRNSPCLIPVGSMLSLIKDFLGRAILFF